MKKIKYLAISVRNFNGNILFLDLDLVITGKLDRFFSFHKGKYCVIENWTQKGSNIGNTSCFRFPVGKYDFILKKFNKDPYQLWKNTT
mgnify:CR=1 FL=1|tara:strand:+ start:513 stop:776 length:264 start_codon:yes stop_codon:yes gene_type:complete